MTKPAHHNAPPASLTAVALETARATSKWAVRAPLLFSTVAFVVAVGATIVGTVWATGQAQAPVTDDRVQDLARRVLEAHPRLVSAMTREEFLSALSQRDREINPATNAALAKIEAKLDALMQVESLRGQEQRESLGDLRQRVDQLFLLLSEAKPPPK